jgi:hypothetical protein
MAVDIARGCACILAALRSAGKLLTRLCTVYPTQASDLLAKLVRLIEDNGGLLSVPHDASETVLQAVNEATAKTV